jgi:DNA-binding beta-propeller fold protein YncE
MASLKKMTQLISVLFILLVTLSGCAQPIKHEQTTVFYPPPPALPRIQFLYTLTRESDIGVEQSDFERFLLGPDIEFAGVVRPYDVSSGSGKIYVMDRAHDKTFIFDLLNRRLGVLEDTTHPDGIILYGGGIWVGADGVQYIADIKRKQILVFDADNNYTGAYGDETVFEKPVDVAVFESNIYVCDHKKHNILVLDKASGKVIQTIGEPGTEDHQLNRPTHVTVDDKGFVYVTDAFNFKIKKFSADGTFVHAFGGVGDEHGKFARPKGVAVDQQGNVYVVDAASEQVQIFNKDGDLLLFFGGPGANAENLWLPAGIAIDYKNVDYFKNFADLDFKIEYLIYVANMAGPGRTNVYGFGKWIGDRRRLDQVIPEKDGNIDKKVKEVQ